jgi:hypothetical protein
MTPTLKESLSVRSPHRPMAGVPHLPPILACELGFQPTVPTTIRLIAVCSWPFSDWLCVEIPICTQKFGSRLAALSGVEIARNKIPIGCSLRECERMH